GGGPHPCGGLSGERNLLAGKARLVADHGAGAALGLQAVAHGNTHGLAFEGKRELSAAAGGTAGGHGRLRGSSMRANCSRNFRLENHGARRSGHLLHLLSVAPAPAERQSFRSSIKETSAPAIRAQNGAPMLSTGMPATVTRNVTSAPSVKRPW